jgi:hypothetical protein
MTAMCNQVQDQLSELVDGDRDAIARHADHLAGCEACRDARHEAARLAAAIAAAGDDHVAAGDLVARLLDAVDAEARATPRGNASWIATDDTPTIPALGAPAIAASAAASSIAVPPAAAITADGAPTAITADGAPTAITADGAPPAPAAPPSAIAASTAPPAAWSTAQALGPPGSATSIAGQDAGPARGAAARRSRAGAGIAAGVALAAGVAAVLFGGRGAEPGAGRAPEGPIATLATVERAAPQAGAGPAGVEIRSGAGWRAIGKGEPVPAGAELRTDERTRAALELTDGSKLVLDHRTQLAFASDGLVRLADGRIAADIGPGAAQLAAVATPAAQIDLGHDRAGGAGARFSVTATDALTAVRVTRGAVVLASARGRDEVRAGEEGVVDGGAPVVSAAPGLAHEAAWSELAPPAQPAPEVAASGLGALRAYKPGESRDRDWNLALARHDVKIRVVGPVARTEITETFRNDSAETLEGVYQFPLPPDAQIDSLALDVDGGFIEGAFLDKERGAKIWRGVIAKATPRVAVRPSQEIIWVEGQWRDPALLDWKRGGRFELRVFPIPARGARTIKLAYTQVVAPRGSWRQYSYPLPYSRDGSTVADQLTVDVELRGAEPGRVRTAGYDLVADPARADVHGLTLRQAGFVPRGDLVIDYRATEGDAELRAWTFAGGAAAAPDDRIAATRNVGIDPGVVAAQRAVAADLRPTAVLALRPRLPRWRDSRPRDYLIVVDGSQSMVGERFARATELATSLVERIDRRDRVGLAVCDTECRQMGELRSPSSAAAGEAARWLSAQVPAGASDVVATLREAAGALGRAPDREPWILYIGDGFASTGFRRVGDVERAIASTVGAGGAGTGARITTIGIGSDADAAVLQAAARGGGGSYLAWVPGQRAAIAAAAALESTVGAALRDATVELPAGLSDVAPTVLPTLRAGEEVLIAARMTGEVTGDVIVRGRVAGQPFEQRYPLALAVSSAAGNGFVPRLWARLAIDQLERSGAAGDRAKIVALSQGYGVMSRETSLLVLESQAMFDAFGVDRARPATTWTGEDELEETASSGLIAHLGDGNGNGAGTEKNKPQPTAATTRPAADALADAGEVSKRRAPHAMKPSGSRGRGAMIQLRRVWVRSPSVAPYDTVHPSIVKAIGDAEAALAASPDRRERHRALVQALSYAGELGRARDVAQRWLERDQLDPQALGYVADLLGRDGERELALRTLAGLVDLDADRAALHERMVRTYEHAGRLAQACGHRIAIAALQPTRAAASAGAVRCLRALGRAPDAELILHAVPGAARAAVEKAVLIAPAAPPLTGELVVDARWAPGEDLDVTLVTPDGERVSWMGGRGESRAGHATSRERERLAVRTLRRGNYLVEISRAGASPVWGAIAGSPVRGTLDVSALGARRSIPFELTGTRAVVGRIAVRLEQRFEDLDGNPVLMRRGPDGRALLERR